MRNKIFYIARFNPSVFNDVSDTNINYSVIRKVSGTCSALTMNNNLCYILRTSTCKGDLFKKTTFKKFGKFIVVTPKQVNLKIRYVNYIINIVLTTFLFVKLVGRCRPKHLLFWDFLPDTCIPAVISGRLHKNITVVPDIEEFISADDLAPKIFKWFEKLMLRKQWSVILTAGMCLNNKVKFERKVVIKGYFAVSPQEEEDCKKYIKYSQGRRKNETKIVVFTGRVDSMRGFDEFLRLAKMVDKDKFIFKAYGFGDREILDYYEKQSVGFVETLFHSDRKTMLLGIINSDFCFNYLSETSFVNGSFPSKLVEYHCLGGSIVSNHAVNDDEIKPFVFRNLNELSSFITSYDQYEHRKNPEMRLLSFSIVTAANKLKVLN